MRLHFMCREIGLPQLSTNGSPEMGTFVFSLSIVLVFTEKKILGGVTKMAVKTEEEIEKIVDKYMKRSGIRRIYVLDRDLKTTHLKLEFVIRGRILGVLPLWNTTPLFPIEECYECDGTGTVDIDAIFDEEYSEDLIASVQPFGDVEDVASSATIWGTICPYCDGVGKVDSWEVKG